MTLLHLLNLTHILTIFITLLLIYHLLLTQINIDKISIILSKILPIKIVNFFIKSLTKVQKSHYYMIIYLLILLLIAELLSYHYFNFFVENIDEIIVLCFINK